MWTVSLRLIGFIPSVNFIVSNEDAFSAEALTTSDADIGFILNVDYHVLPEAVFSVEGITTSDADMGFISQVDWLMYYHVSK